MTAGFGGHGSDRSRLRVLVATIDRAVTSIVQQGRTDAELIASWAEVVELLALGPEPETRECPVCRQVVMLNATRCGYCWTKLSPLRSSTEELGAVRIGD
jgi:hypothetical protein